MNKIIVLATILFVIFSLCPSLAMEVSEKLFRQEEELLLLGEEFVITPTKTKKKVGEAPAIVTVITAEEIKNMGARDLLDVLKIVPGLGISIGHYGTYQIEVRGIKTLNSEKVLLMLDGHTINFPFDGGATRFYDNLVVNNIKRIEIVRGPGSALYGANAFVAVINIITKKAKDINGTEVRGGGGSFDTWYYNVLFGKESDKFKISGYIDYVDTNGPRLRVEEDILSPASFSDAPGHTQDWNQRTDLNLNLSYGDITLWAKYLEEHRGPYIGVGYALNDESELFQKDLRGELNFQHAFKNKLDVLTRLYGSYESGDYFWEIYPEGFMGLFPDGMLGGPQLKESTVGGEIKLDYELIRWDTVTLGMVYEVIKQFEVKSYVNFDPNTGAPLAGGYQDVSDWGNFNKTTDRRVWALYVQNDLDLLISYGIDLVLGVRYDHYSEFGGAISPRAGLIWQFIPDAELKLLYGEAFRAPSFEELYNKNNPAVLGNPDLDPEKLWTTEAGLAYRFTPHILVRLNYFHTEIDDLIRLQAIGSGSRYENTGGADIDGIEAEIRTDFGKGNYGFVNYTYQHAEEFGEDTPDVPNYRANLGVNLNPWKYLNSNTSILFTGSRPRAEGDSRDDLSAYAIVNQTLIVKNLFETLEIRGSVYNLFDKDYSDPAPPATTENDFPRPGRNYTLEVCYKF